MYLLPAVAALTTVLTGHHETVTVHHGDTLAAIAGRWCGTEDDYPGLAEASGIDDPDRIIPGQAVTITCTPGVASPRVPAVTTAVYRHHRGYAPRHNGRGEDGYRPGRHAAGYAARHTRRHRATRAAPAVGGTYSPSALEALWQSAGGPAWAAPRAARIAMCESGGQANAYNPSGATGLFQIKGQVVPGNLYDPYVNALNAVAKFKASGNTFAQWVCQ